MFKLNEVKANFINLDCSIWSNKELSKLRRTYATDRCQDFAVVDSDNWIKNTKAAIEVCKANKWSYRLIKSNSWEEFISKLSDCSALVFFPVARESCCRLLVEAKCIGLNVITNDNSGAFRSVWFNLSGPELIDYLEEGSKKNLSVIQRNLE